MEIIKLGKLSNVTAGQAAPKKFSSKGLPFIRAGHIQDLLNGYDIDKLPKVNEEIAQNNKLKIIPKGSVLFAKSGMSATKNRVMITCRESYIVSHLAAILPSDKICSKYLSHFLFWFNPAKLILDEAYPSIRLSEINNLNIPFPTLKTQQKIAAILDEADKLRRLNKKLIKKYEQLSQSLFLEMFGDPVSNPKGWEILPLKKFGTIITGNTPSRNNSEFYSSNFIEWIKTDNITTENIYITNAKEYLSELGLSSSRYAIKGSLLVACIAGSINSIGRASLTDRKVSFNQQINALQPNNDVSSFFLYHLFKNTSKYIQDHATNGMKRILTKGAFEKIEMIKPPVLLQNQFAERVQEIDKQKTQAQQVLKQSEDLFNSLLQRAFKGELVKE